MPRTPTIPIDRTPLYACEHCGRGWGDCVPGCESRKCKTQIVVEGFRAFCELENGPDHNPEHGFMHRARVDWPDGSGGMVVEWSYWRKVDPRMVRG